MATKTAKLPRVILIHGIQGESPPEMYLTRLAQYFQDAGFTVCIPRYGTLDLFGISFSSWANERISQSLGSFVEPGDILLGHSNGGAISYLIAQKKRVRGVILINAALDSNRVPNAEFTHVYFNKGDWVTRASTVLPFNAWGAMGALGYTGAPRPDIVNVDCGNPPYDDLPRLSGHSTIFKGDNLAPWARYMAQMAKLEIV